MKRITLYVLILSGALAFTSCLVVTVHAEDASALPPVQLSRLIETALRDNPDLKALRSRIEANRAKVPQAGSLPNPEVGVMLADGLDPSRGVQFTAKQMFPGSGKLGLMKEVASLEADRTATDYTEKASDIVSQVKSAYYSLYFVDRSTEIALTNKSLLADFVKIAETKYSTGAGLQQDVLRAQLAQSRILDDLLMLRQERQTAEARLNALLNRPPDTPIGPAVEFTRHEVSLSQAQLEQMALEHRAMLKGMALMTAAAQAEERLARRDLRPDYELQVDLNRNGAGMGQEMRSVSVGVMVSLPLYHRTKQDKAIEQREHEVNAAQSSYQAQRAMVFSMIKDRVSMLERADRQIELFHSGIIPQAQLSLESARAGYQVNKVDFLTLLDNQMSLYNDLRDYYRALTDYETTLAELEQTVGASLGTREAAGAQQPAAQAHPASAGPAAASAPAASAPRPSAAAAAATKARSQAAAPQPAKKAQPALKRTTKSAGAAGTPRRAGKHKAGGRRAQSAKKVKR